jgi:hypothetical protein
MEKPTGKRLPTALPQTLEIDSTDFHIPSAPEKTARLSRIQNPKEEPASPTLRLLQAHLWIRKDYYSTLYKI